ncbi:glutamate receptor 2.8 [Actinidia rufa]|uniref:Glutamate receptor 2.8 n=1 Tax=Actinidia rufa TaxID=165716 RepID=A0A7J0GBT0_9ERIC|nr:glutamate receptor 2.8 [Actinidia rufa]
MQGVIGIKPYVPRTKRLKDFTLRWDNKYQQEKVLANYDLTVFGLWAYDAAIALAMAVERVWAPSFSFQSITNRSRNPSDVETFGVSQFGKDLSRALSSTAFRGLSGSFNFVNGQLQSSAFQIVNVLGNEERSDTTHAPKGWVVPTSGRVLRIGVPVKDTGFSEFVRVTRDASTNITSVTGYCIDIFEATMKALPYHVPYEYIPFAKPDGKSAGSYDEMLHQVLLGNFDAVAGDVTILANRSLLVDFTLPYTESGVIMVVPYKSKEDKNAWVFLKPLTWDLWVASACFFVFMGFVIWILEHQTNEDFSGSHLHQVGTSCWFSLSTMVFAHSNLSFPSLLGEKVVSNLARYLLKARLWYPDVSRAILNVTGGENMAQIENTWIGKPTICQDLSSTRSSSSLSFSSFWGLFLIVGVAASFALIIFTAMLVYEHRVFLMHLDLKAWWRKKKSTDMEAINSPNIAILTL